MPILRTNFEGDPNIGLYGFATDKYCLLGKEFRNHKKIEEALGVEVILSRIMDTELTGIFVAGNSSGIIVPYIIDDEELSYLKNKFEKVVVLKSDYSALGNLILMNDNGIVLSQLLKREKGNLQNKFGIKCAVSKIARINVVGSVAFTTNKGCLTHPRLKKDERIIIEETLGIKSNISTVSFGSPFVKSGIVANSKGLVVSESSSGPELGRITETLGFV